LRRTLEASGSFSGVAGGSCRRSGGKGSAKEVIMVSSTWERRGSPSTVLIVEMSNDISKREKVLEINFKSINFPKFGK